MPIALPHVADRLFGRPHAIEPMALQAIVEGPAGRRVLAGEAIEAGKKGKKSRDFKRERLAMVAGEVVSLRDGLIQYAITTSGIAVIPIAGVLTQKFDWLAAMCGWSTYDSIGATLDQARGDYRVKAILFDVDSPGGEVSGMMEIARTIMAARAEKPIWAIANPLAASAAYLIAGAASRLCVTELGHVGSIGCVTVHLDQSAADMSQGLRYTAIYSGARKIDGWGHAPLSEEALAAVQAEVDFVRAKFAGLVGTQDRISAEKAMATEAAMYSGENAVKSRLADEVLSFDETVAALSDAIKSPKGDAMSTAALRSTSALTPPANPAAASAVEPVAPLAMSAPGPGEKCELCGQVMDNEEHVTKAQAAAIAAAAGPSTATTPAVAYSVDDAAETTQLCLIAGAPQLASAFVASKTPVAKVRAALAKRAADAADATAINPMPPPAGKPEAAVAAQWDEIVGKINAEASRGKK